MVSPEPGFFRSVLDASPSPVMVFEADADGYFILYVNPAFELRTGYAARTVRGRDWRALYAHEPDAAELKRLRSAIDAGSQAQAVLRGHRKDGAEFWSELHVAPLPSDNGGRRQYVGILRDITTERAWRQQLEHRALHDALTGLPNRYLFQDRLERAVDHARSRNCTFALIAVDLDDFKQVNDVFGHPAGDELLRQVALRLTQAMRAGDTVARIGGDEFVLLLESVRDRGALAGVLRRLVDLVEQPAIVAGEYIDVRCSLGVSRYPFDGLDAVSLISEADRAMYRQKAGHRIRLPYGGERALPDVGAASFA